MSEYGVTKTGVNIKRLDVILDEMHEDLSKGWGVNTRINPESYLNVQLTAFGDKIAELWEFGQQIYDSYHPSTAEDSALDSACQYAGVERQTAAQTIYPIHCTGTDGTVLEAGTVVSADTNPRIDFSLSASKSIERASFNRTRIRVVAVSEDTTYTISINGTLYSYTTVEGDGVEQILSGLAERVSAGGEFVAVVAEETAELPMTLLIEAADVSQNYNMLLTENLTTETVTSIINFSSVDYGEVIVPNGAISIITKGPSTFISCTNLCSYVAGRLRETDTEFRQSYADKVFNLSDRTLQAIKAAILTNVQGVNSVAVYENDQDYVDAAGRYPHSIEVIVDGGSPAEIATQIFKRKAGGINTYGSTEVDLVGNNGEPITIRFNRPSYIYVWWRIGITQDPSSQLPSDYAAQIKSIIVKAMSELETGDDVIPQRVFKTIYETIPGIAYIDVRLFSTSDGATSPEGSDTYTLRSLTLSDRELGITSDTMVEVALDG